MALIHISFAIQSRKLRSFFTPLSILIVLSSLYAFSTIEHSEQKRIVIYNVYKHSVIDFMNGDICFSFTEQDTLSTTIENKIKYAVSNHRTQLKINKIHTLHFYDSLKIPQFSYFKGLSQFGSFRLAILDKLPNTPIDVPFDAVLIRNNPRFSMEELNEKIQFTQLIVDASNNRRNVDMWKNMCITIDKPFYDINESGAWAQNF
jgi:hypothetical protein